MGLKTSWKPLSAMDSGIFHSIIFKDLGKNMGRHSSGKITTDQAHRLELSYLLKNGFIQQGEKIRAFVAWNNGHAIRMESDFRNQDKFIRLSYQIKRPSGKAFQMDYVIQLESIPSNLGRGEVYYFKCPASGIRSRILYLAYGSPIFKARDSYQIQIFYQSQIISSWEYHKERYFSIEDSLSRLEAKIKKSHYRGKKTRLIKRIERLQQESYQHNIQSLISFCKKFGIS